MKIPSRRTENKLNRKGFRKIAGMDEAGRGALAGPIVGACVVLPEHLKIKGLRDSKLLSEKARESLYLKIIRNAEKWSVSVVSSKKIDKIGIQEANALVFRLALRKLGMTPDYVLIDGKKITHLPVPYEYVTGGDSSVACIAAASIVAKVTRDHIMNRMHMDFPEYGFSAHKGYGTISHVKSIKTLGPVSAHRMSFKPLSN